MKKYLLFFVLFVLTTNLFSQIPQTISWQGIIQDGQGNNLNGEYNLSIRFFDVATGGTALWSETHNNAQINDGLANLVIGSVTALNLPFDKEYWLEIQVGNNNPLPRIKLTSVPYSLYSKKASGIIENDSLVMKDNRGVTRMVLNPNTGTFKMMNNDTTWYEVSVQSPKVEIIKDQNGGTIKYEGSNYYYYGPNGNLLLKHEETSNNDYDITTETKYREDGTILEKVENQFGSQAGSSIFCEIITTTKYDENGVITEKTETKDCRSSNSLLQQSKYEKIKESYKNNKIVSKSEYIEDKDASMNKNTITKTETSFDENENKTFQIEEINDIKNGTKSTRHLKYNTNATGSKSFEIIQNEQVLNYKINNFDDGKFSSFNFLNNGINFNLNTSRSKQANIQTTNNGIKFEYVDNSLTKTPSLSFENNSGSANTYFTSDKIFHLVDYWYNQGESTFDKDVTVNKNVKVNENIDIKKDINTEGVKKFRIDHPTNSSKYLQHAAIESNQVLNVYSGNVTTNSSGFAIVTMPNYFKYVNDIQDIRYNLTVISSSFVNAVISTEYSEETNSFVIKTSSGNTKVSWQVIAKRNDSYMQNNPFYDVINK